MSLNREQPMRPFLDELADAFDGTPLEYVRTFDTVAAMQAATDLQSGMTCHTNGFHANGDGGAAYYTIGTTGTANGMDVLTLQGGLLATIVFPDGFITPNAIGAYGNGVNDDSSYFARAFALAIASGNPVSLVGESKYRVAITIGLNTETHINVYGNGATIIPIDGYAITVNYTRVNNDKSKVVTSKIRDITFSYSSNDSGALMLVSAQDTTYTSKPFDISGLNVLENATTTTVPAIYTENFNGLSIHACTFLGNSNRDMQAIEIKYGINYFITGCEAMNCYDLVTLTQGSSGYTALEGVTVSNCLALSSRYAVYEQRESSSTNHDTVGLNINGCMFDQLYDGCLHLLISSHTKITNNFMGTVADVDAFSFIHFEHTSDSATTDLTQTIINGNTFYSASIAASTIQVYAIEFAANIDAFNCIVSNNTALNVKYFIYAANSSATGSQCVIESNGIYVVSAIDGRACNLADFGIWKNNAGQATPIEMNKAFGNAGMLIDKKFNELVNIPSPTTTWTYTNKLGHPLILFITGTTTNAASMFYYQLNYQKNVNIAQPFTWTGFINNATLYLSPGETININSDQMSNITRIRVFG